MLTGAHAIIYSTKPDADRDFLRDVLKLSHVDVGRGWLIFGLPPSEIAVHPSETSSAHEIYLMCDDLEAFMAEMSGRNISCGAVQNQPWGALTHMTLPGGGTLGVYQPRHARPEPMTIGKKTRSAPAKRRSRKPVRSAAPLRARAAKKRVRR
jgi:hypothetical protein